MNLIESARKILARLRGARDPIKRVALSRELRDVTAKIQIESRAAPQSMYPDMRLVGPDPVTFRYSPNWPHGDESS